MRISFRQLYLFENETNHFARIDIVILIKTVNVRGRFLIPFGMTVFYLVIPNGAKRNEESPIPRRCSIKKCGYFKIIHRSSEVGENPNSLYNL